MPALVVQSGLAKFNLMLEMNAPGTVPDPLLIAALIDLVSTELFTNYVLDKFDMMLKMNAPGTVPNPLHTVDIWTFTFHEKSSFV